MANADVRQVSSLLYDQYNTEELKEMCHELDGIDYEDIGGSGKRGKAREIATFMERRGRLAEVVAYVQRTRPQVQIVAEGTTPPPQTSSSAPIYHIHGDYIAGDKVAGDQVGGDKTTIGNISDSSGIAVGRESSAEVNKGDTINMSGDFRGANVNVKSTLSNVSQTIGTLPQANDAERMILQQLVMQLNDALQQVPSEKAADADAVTQFTETLVDTANNESPNQMIMEITGEGLKKAAANLAGIVPDIVKITGAIVAGILGFG